MQGGRGGRDKSKTFEGSPEVDTPSDEGIESLASTANSHKRTISGSILSRFAFLRSSSESKATGPSNGDNPPAEAGVTKRADVVSSSASPIVQHNAAIAATRKTRSRRGSLRKTALLGGGKLRSTEKRLQMDASTSLKADDSFIKASNEIDFLPVPLSPPDPDDFPTPRASYESKPASSSVGDGSVSINALQDDTDGQERSNTSEESLPLPSALRRDSTIGDMSTTDEDESARYPSRLLSVGLPSSPGSSSVLNKNVAGESWFSMDISTLQRRRSSHRPRAKSPLAALPVEPVPPTVEEWDYSETEWWGWVILVLTWMVFVMGMGSCFDVWSWAWDVGETPYAPPELEDDPTLPIVGYYPALIILTGVMAWVWVVVAWVGMKYFRHAKMAGDV